MRYLCHEALKQSTGRDFGYDHLSDNLVQRRQSILEWRTWWSDLSGDPWFAKSYAEKHGLAGEEGQPANPPAMPDVELQPESGQEMPEETGAEVPQTAPK